MHSDFKNGVHFLLKVKNLDSMAATKEQSISDKLKLLYNLQQVDSKLDEISVIKGELPMEVSDLEDEISGLSLRLKKLENSLADIDRNCTTQ